jgi:hypothetical protein
MKTATKVIFTSALMLLVVAPTLSHAAYFEDQTKTWATNTHAQDVVTRHKGAAQTQVPREGIREFYGTDNTSVPGAGVDKDDTTPKSN